MNRRLLLKSSVFAGILRRPGKAEARTADGKPREEAGRPPIAIEQQADGGWRVRSWAAANGEWRPLAARVEPRPGGGYAIRGRVADADRDALAAWIAARPA